MYYGYQFTAEITKYDFDKYFYTVVFLPTQLAESLPFGDSKRLRIEGEIDWLSLQGALMPSKGRWYLMVSRRILKQLSKSVGDEVEVRFKIADQSAVELPTVLQEFLHEHPKLKLKWDSLTPGKKRGLAYKVAQAKTEGTQVKRLAELKQLLLELQ